MISVSSKSTAIKITISIPCHRRRQKPVLSVLSLLPRIVILPPSDLTLNLLISTVLVKNVNLCKPMNIVKIVAPTVRTHVKLLQ